MIGKREQHLHAPAAKAADDQAVFDASLVLAEYRLTVGRLLWRRRPSGIAGVSGRGKTMNSVGDSCGERRVSAIAVFLLDLADIEPVPRN